MHTFDPERTDPIYWCLTEVLGLPRAEVARKAKIAQPTITSLLKGKRVGKAPYARLRELLERKRDEVMEPTYRLPKPVAAYRRAAFDVINHYLEETAPPPPPLPKNRQSELKTLLKAHIPTSNPARANTIIAQVMSSGYERRVVRRAAERLGVIKTVYVGVEYWKLKA